MAVKFGDGIDLQSQKGIHAADGSAADDLATWGQVQQFIAGLSWKQEVQAASTANVSVASAPTTIDGVALAVGRVLLKNQTAPAENGIYTFSAAASPLIRATDMDDSTDFNNATVSVTSGTINADTSWTCTTANPTVGTTAIVIVAFAAGLTYSNGNGLALSGTTFSVKLPGSGVIGLVVDSTGVYIDATVVVRKYAGNAGDGSSTNLAVVHALGTKDITWSVRTVSGDIFQLTDGVATDANTLTLTYAAAPALNALRVVVHG